MNNGPNRSITAGHEKVWASLAEQGWAVTSDRSISLPRKFRRNFRKAYFNPENLRHDEGDMPVDRQRARDVIRYQWHGGDLRLNRHESITITDRAGIPGEREHARVELLEDAQAVDLLHAFLQLVPEERRKPEGT